MKILFVSNVLLCMTGGQENRNSLKFSLHVKYKIGTWKLESKLCVELLLQGWKIYTFAITSGNAPISSYPALIDGGVVIFFFR